MACPTSPATTTTSGNLAGDARLAAQPAVAPVPVPAWRRALEKMSWCIRHECALHEAHREIPLGVEWHPFHFGRKLLGKAVLGPERAEHPWRFLWAGVGAFLSTGLLAVLQVEAFAMESLPFLLAGAAATMCLIFGVPEAAVSQPRNVICGHTLSALLGVTCRNIVRPSADTVDSLLWLACALAVGLAISAMMALNCVHPPAASTALVAVIGGAQVEDAGYLLVPVAAAFSTLLVACAVAWNNFGRHHRYPQWWL